MVKGRRKLHIPNDHGSEISQGLLREILRQGGISMDEWASA